MINKRSIIILLLVPFILFAVSGCSGQNREIAEKVQEALSDEPASIEEIVVCEEVNEDYSPIDGSNSFTSDIYDLYLSIKINNLSPEDNLKVVWSYLETDQEIKVQEFSPENKGSGYTGFNIRITEGFPSGNYSVSVYLNEALEDTISFKIE